MICLGQRRGIVRLGWKVDLWLHIADRHKSAQRDIVAPYNPKAEYTHPILPSLQYSNLDAYQRLKQKPTICKHTFTNHKNMIEMNHCKLCYLNVFEAKKFWMLQLIIPQWASITTLCMGSSLFKFMCVICEVFKPR